MPASNLPEQNPSEDKDSELSSDSPSISKFKIASINDHIAEHQQANKTLDTEVPMPQILTIDDPIGKDKQENEILRDTSVSIPDMLSVEDPIEQHKKTTDKINNKKPVDKPKSQSKLSSMVPQQDNSNLVQSKIAGQSIMSTAIKQIVDPSSNIDYTPEPKTNLLTKETQSQIHKDAIRSTIKEHKPVAGLLTKIANSGNTDKGEEQDKQQGPSL